MEAVHDLFASPSSLSPTRSQESRSIRHIRIYEVGQERKDEIAKRVTRRHHRGTACPRRRVVVIERSSPHWYAAGRPGSRSRSDGWRSRPSPHAVVAAKVEFEKSRATACSRGRWQTDGQVLLWSTVARRSSARWSAVTASPRSASLQQVQRPDLGRQGRLLACEHASSQVSRTEPDGRITSIATHYEGKQ